MVKSHPLCAWWPYALSPKHVCALYVHVDICRSEVTRLGLMIRPLMMQELMLVSFFSRLCGLPHVTVTLCICMHFVGRWSLPLLLSRYFPSSRIRVQQRMERRFDSQVCNGMRKTREDPTEDEGYEVPFSPVMFAIVRLTYSHPSLCMFCSGFISSILTWCYSFCPHTRSTSAGVCCRYLEWQVVEGTFVYQYQKAGYFSGEKYIHKVRCSRLTDVTVIAGGAVAAVVLPVVAASRGGTTLQQAVSG